MMLMNLTQCEERKTKCLGDFICCYECDYRGWCDAKCTDTMCRRIQIMRRLNYGKDALEEAYQSRLSRSV